MLDPIDIVLNLKPCHYKYNDKMDLDEKIHYGFLAQDLLASFGDKYAFVAKDKNSDYLKVNYFEFIAPIVSIVKKQQEEIEILKKEIENINRSIKS